ncbi:hypothetical protein N7490_000859 [Penicillium lividum]|nr:hypothetical protein N7490_000859 [Penicillium lividum]
MHYFVGLFRSRQRAASTPPAPRHSWTRLRRSHSAAVPLIKEPQQSGTSEEIRTTHLGEDGANDEAVNEIDDQVDGGVSLKRQTSNVPEHPGNDGNHSEQRESPHGGRMKGLLSRLRLGRSQDRSSVSELLPVIPQEAAGDPMTTDPVKKDVPSLHPPAQEQRNFSAQTVISQESNQTTATVDHHPSQRIPMAIDEPNEDWLGLMNYPTHHPEPSDPFSDGKKIESGQAASSGYDGDHSQRESGASVHSRVESERQPSSKSHSSHRPNATRVSSVSSHASRGSRLSRVDPSKAAIAFDALAAQLNIPLSIQGDDPVIATPEKLPEEARRRYRFSRIRPTQSNQTLGETSNPPFNKLRRTKTFASLGRRPSPMSSLRGKSVEFIARLGGHSYLILPCDLAPGPLQLPACIVAMAIYLRKSAPHSTELFIEPGDMKAATRLYNHFANQVLLSERDAHKIAMTTRVVAIPHVEAESNAAAVLSVGWVFKELMAGLPGGIFGSVRLFQILYSIYLAGPANPGCVRLVTLAIMALSGEMQCALICAVFGLLTSLLQKTENMDDQTGTSVRPVANPLQPDGLARVFGPLLVGGRDRDRAAQSSVEQEVEEQRVVELLLDHWRGVSRQLREWTGDSRTGKRD